jgi:vitamin B12 transporter
MFEQFGSNLAYFAPNPNLKPEQSLGWDAGVEVKLLGGRALLDVTYFRANLTNEIKTDYSVFPSTPINLDGQSQRQGVEVSLKGAVNAWLTAGMSYTYTDARDPTGAVEVRRAPHTGRIDATAAFAEGRGTITVAAVYNGAMTDFRFTNVSDGFGGTLPSLAGRAGLQPYWLLTFGASYKIQPNMEIYGRIENALDAKYQEQYGYSTARIAAYAGVKISFDDLLGVKK